jgi:hypothetical protein
MTRPSSLRTHAPHPPVLETRRLLLRLFLAADLDGLARICSDPELTKHLGPRGEPMSRAETETALRGIFEHWRRHGFGRRAAVPKGATQLVGYAGLRSFGVEVELVYLLERECWGSGAGHGVGTRLSALRLRPAGTSARRGLHPAGERRLASRAGEGGHEVRTRHHLRPPHAEGRRPRPADKCVEEMSVAAYALTRTEAPLGELS